MSYSVKLAALPGGKVTVAVARSSSGSQDSDLRVSDGASLTFTTDNWHSYQLVELSADDDADEVNGTAVRRLTPVNDDDGSDESVAIFAHGLPVAIMAGWLTLLWRRNATMMRPTICSRRASVETALAVSENGSAVYGVKLQVQPSGTVWLDIGRRAAAAATGICRRIRFPREERDVKLKTLVFTTDDWNAYQSVTGGEGGRRYRCGGRHGGDSASGRSGRLCGGGVSLDCHGE